MGDFTLEELQELKTCIDNSIADLLPFCNCFPDNESEYNLSLLQAFNFKNLSNKIQKEIEERSKRKW